MRKLWIPRIQFGGLITPRFLSCAINRCTNRRCSGWWDHLNTGRLRQPPTSSGFSYQQWSQRRATLAICPHIWPKWITSIISHRKRELLSHTVARNGIPFRKASAVTAKKKTEKQEFTRIITNSTPPKKKKNIKKREEKTTSVFNTKKAGTCRWLHEKKLPFESTHTSGLQTGAIKRRLITQEFTTS